MYILFVAIISSDSILTSNVLVHFVIYMVKISKFLHLNTIPFLNLHSFKVINLSQMIHVSQIITLKKVIKIPIAESDLITDSRLLCHM